MTRQRLSPRRVAIRLAGVFVLTMLAQAASAVTYPDLYQITVAREELALAPGTGEAERRRAVEQLAMARLLVRVTGRRDAPLAPELTALLESARDYGDGTYGEIQPGRYLVGFSRPRIEQALTALQWPILGPERPLTAIWLAVDNGNGERVLLGNETPPGVSPEMTVQLDAMRTELRAVAAERALPIVLPLLDLEDLNRVTVPDVLGRFEEPVIAASARYGADATLIGRVQPGPFGTEIEWLLAQGAERRLLGGFTVGEGLQGVADYYASVLGVVGAASRTQLAVLDVRTFDDYARVLTYLDRVSVVQAYEWQSHEQGTLKLAIVGRGDARQLEGVFALDRVLAPAGPSTAGGGVVPPPGGVGPGTLVFRLVPTAGP